MDFNGAAVDENVLPNANGAGVEDPKANGAGVDDPKANGAGVDDLAVNLAPKGYEDAVPKVKEFKAFSSFFADLTSAHVADTTKSPRRAAWI